MFIFILCFCNWKSDIYDVCCVANCSDQEHIGNDSLVREPANKRTLILRQTRLSNDFFSCGTYSKWTFCMIKEFFLSCKCRSAKKTNARKCRRKAESISVLLSPDLDLTYSPREDNAEAKNRGDREFNSSSAGCFFRYMPSFLPFIQFNTRLALLSASRRLFGRKGIFWRGVKY